jgi:predicted DCC family thiol-disulfide oxidoreductase YuxK
VSIQLESLITNRKLTVCFTVSFSNKSTFASFALRETALEALRRPAHTLSETKPNPIILYDGVCGLCNRLVQFVLKRDKRDYFRFASLQSDWSISLLQRYNLDPHDLDTVYIVIAHDQPGEQLLARSDAILFLLRHLGGIWKVAAVGKVLPRALRDVIYKLVARNRYRVFGKYESCMLPAPQHRAKFLGV